MQPEVYEERCGIYHACYPDEAEYDDCFLYGNHSNVPEMQYESKTSVYADRRECQNCSGDKEGLNESEGSTIFQALFPNKNHNEHRLEKQTDCQVRQREPQEQNICWLMQSWRRPNCAEDEEISSKGRQREHRVQNADSDVNLGVTFVSPCGVIALI